MSASAVVLPYLKRATVGGPPETIVYTPVGTATTLVATQTSLGGVNMAAGDTILCAVITDNAANVDTWAFELNGTPPIGGSFNTWNTGTWWLAVGAWFTGQAPLAGVLTVDWAGSAGFPTTSAMIVTKVSGLIAAPLDKTAFGQGASGTQDSGFTAATAQAHEFCWGIIGTTGNSLDTLGAWQDGFTAGQRAANVSCDLKEGYNIVNAIAARRARITGATSRTFGARIDTYKAA